MDCPFAITMAKLDPEFSSVERSLSCLYWDEEAETFTGFGEGKKDAYGICKDTRTVCQRVGEAKTEIANEMNISRMTVHRALQSE